MRKKEALKRYVFIGLIQLFLSIFTISSGIIAKQAIAVHVIALFISSTFLFWDRRVSFAFLGVALLLFLNVLDIKHLLEFASLNIILFLLGMMIIVGYLEKHHLFDHLILKILQRFRNKPRLVLVILLVLSAVTAALIDEVTSILIMTSITLKLVHKLKLRPLPFLLMVIFATNIGSSATVVGNPVGVIIALRAGLTFTDFLGFATPISLLVLALSIVVSLVYFRKDIDEYSKGVKSINFESMAEDVHHSMKRPALLFLFTIFCLVLHTTFEKALGLEKNTLLIGTALAGAGIALLWSRDQARELVERRVDWWTLTFFMFLFSSVGSLEYTGFIDVIGDNLLAFVQNDPTIAVIVTFLGSGVLSAMLDNVLAVAVVAPVVQDLAPVVTPGDPILWWSLLFGCTLFGNLTHIGSTANIVALGIFQKQDHAHIKLKDWIIPGAITTFVTGAIALGILIFFV